MVYVSPADGINATKGLGEIFNYVGYATDGWFSNLLLIAIYVIVLIGYMKAKDDFKGALAVSGYGTFIVALLLWIGGVISGMALGISIALAIVGTTVLMMDQP